MIIIYDKDNVRGYRESDGLEVNVKISEEQFLKIQNVINNTLTEEEKTAKTISRILSKNSDEDIIENKEFVQEWKLGQELIVGEPFYYNGSIYKSLHYIEETRLDNTPDKAPTLYLDLTAEYEAINNGTFPKWKQPIMTEDSYEMGYVVEHNGEYWESTLNHNVWEPGVSDTWIRYDVSQLV